MADAGVDLAMLDIIGDDVTAQEVYGLSGAAASWDSLAALVEAGLNVAPHIVAGLNHGQIIGEERAVEVALQSGTQTLVFVVLTPLKGHGHGPGNAARASRRGPADLWRAPG